MPKIPKEEEKSKIYVGIDPGLEGGLVAISPQGKVIASPMPETEKGVYLWFIDNSWPVENNVRAVIEKVHSMPDQSAQSGFTFGKGYGGLRMALVAAGIPFEEVDPRKWQKALGIVPKKKEESKAQWKNRLLALAQQLYPNLPLWSEKRAKGKMLAVADALLIATYCQRKHEGKL